MEFEDFARQRLPELVSFAAAICADRATAEDVVQEVMMRVYTRWDRISQMDSPEAYVRRSLVNEYLSWRRKWARMVPHAVVPDRSLPSPDHASLLADRSVLASELAALPARQRTALVMRYYGQLTDAEIAEIFGCRPATVRGYISRALVTLRVDPPSRDAADQTTNRSSRAYRS